MELTVCDCRVLTGDPSHPQDSGASGGEGINSADQVPFRQDNQRTDHSLFSAEDRPATATSQAEQREKENTLFKVQLQPEFTVPQEQATEHKKEAPLGRQPDPSNTTASARQQQLQDPPKHKDASKRRQSKPRASADGLSSLAQAAADKLAKRNSDVSGATKLLASHGSGGHNGASPEADLQKLPENKPDREAGRPAASAILANLTQAASERRARERLPDVSLPKQPPADNPTIPLKQPVLPTEGVSPANVGQKAGAR